MSCRNGAQSFLHTLRGSCLCIGTSSSPFVAIRRSCEKYLHSCKGKCITIPGWKAENLRKSFETKNALQPLNGYALHDHPLRDFRASTPASLPHLLAENHGGMRCIFRSWVLPATSDLA